MKKISWIMALMAALAMLFVGVGCGGGGGDDDVPEAKDLVIEDAAAIGALITPVGYFGDTIAGGDNPVISKDVNKMTYNYADTGAENAGSDHFGFQLDFPEGVEEGHLSLEVTFKLVEVKKLTGGHAKIGFKAKKGSDDVTPYPQHEVVFGGEENLNKDFIQAFSLKSPNKLPNGAVWIAHNQYGSKAADQGSKGETRYTIQITKIHFIGKAAAAAEVKADYFEVGKTLQYLKDSKGAATPIVAPTVTPKDGNDFGAITLAYEGETGTTYARNAEVPQAVGKYKILVSTAGNTAYSAATDLNVGTLTVMEQAPTDLLKLSEHPLFQALTTSATQAEILAAVTELENAGGSLSVVEVGGKKAIQMVTTGNWNGLDIKPTNLEVGTALKVVINVVSATQTGANKAGLRFDVSHDAYQTIGSDVDVSDITGGGAIAPVTGITKEVVIAAGDLVTSAHATHDGNNCTGVCDGEEPIRRLRINLGNVGDVYTIIFTEIIITPPVK